MFTTHLRPFSLRFLKPATTSRGVMLEKHGYLLEISDPESGKMGIGECSVLPGLSVDDRPGYLERLKLVCRDINLPFDEHLELLTEWPSIRFGYECAMLSLRGSGGVIYNTPFTRGEQPIPINGLVWMGDFRTMLTQIEEKLADGYKVIKLKVGAIDFEKEIELLKFIRNRFTGEEVTIRLDANGAFKAAEAPDKLNRLSAYGIHSIEQPIKAGQPDAMAGLCRQSPIPVALDEELIGLHDHEEQVKLLEVIMPQYIILKPSLLGGFTASNQWMEAARELGIGYWITSALESNIGLNAIAQFTSSVETYGLPQGLGTGGLFVENFDSPLSLVNGELWYKP